MKYKDVVFYKDQLKYECNVLSFIYVKISKELYYVLKNELNFKQNINEIDFGYKKQFVCDGMYFLLDGTCKDTKAIFHVIVNDKGNKTNFYNRFANFNIDILSENDRIIKKLLE